ncbi:uncharacterized protein LOC123778161 isoform X2 [Ursus americanus]|uniref:uncharacterized protein LOC123778161 isoform X2 n=1 Tax=Ursus americanus TaxID=9643 RepID=UPI001E67A782|nr:uncharacterized protein LOC123778161 isoform X2 [Ursus americanus]
MRGVHVGCRVPELGRSAFGRMRERPEAGGAPPPGLRSATRTTVREPLCASGSQFPRRIEYHSARRRNNILVRAVTWINLENLCQVRGDESPSGRAHLSHQPLWTQPPGFVHNSLCQCCSGRRSAQRRGRTEVLCIAAHAVEDSDKPQHGLPDSIFQDCVVFQGSSLMMLSFLYILSILSKS